MRIKSLFFFNFLIENNLILANPDPQHKKMMAYIRGFLCLSLDDTKTTNLFDYIYSINLKNIYFKSIS